MCRELDILAEKEKFIEEQKLLLTVYLVIQCKKIPGNSWIFFSGPVSKKISSFSHTQQILTLLDAFELEYEYTYGSTLDKELGPTGFCSSSYTEIITDLGLTNKKTNNLFEAIARALRVVWKMQKVMANHQMHFPLNPTQFYKNRIYL